MTCIPAVYLSNLRINNHMPQCSSNAVTLPYTRYVIQFKPFWESDNGLWGVIHSLEMSRTQLQITYILSQTDCHAACYTWNMYIPGDWLPPQTWFNSFYTVPADCTSLNVGDNIMPLYHHDNLVILNQVNWAKPGRLFSWNPLHTYIYVTYKHGR